MSAVNEIIRLAERLKDAEAKVARLDSLEQATSESEARLAALRDKEDRARAALDAAYSESKRIAAQAKAEADRSWRECQEKLQEETIACHTAVAAREAAAAEELGRVSAAVAEKQAVLAALEAEESKLGQAVAALRADLDALRARVLG